MWNEIWRNGRWDDPAWIEEQLTTAPVERGFFLDDEAVTSLGPHASVRALRILQEQRWIRAIEGKKEGRGTRRCWPLAEIIRAQLAVDLATEWEVSFVSAVAILSPSPATRVAVAGDRATSSSFVEGWLADAASLSSNPTPALAAITMIDRTWLFVSGGELPSLGGVDHDTPLARVISLRSTKTALEPIREDILLSGPAAWRSDDNAIRALKALQDPCGLLRFHPRRSLRRFLNRTQGVPDI